MARQLASSSCGPHSPAISPAASRRTPAAPCAGPAQEWSQGGRGGVPLLSTCRPSKPRTVALRHPDTRCICKKDKTPQGAGGRLRLVPWGHGPACMAGATRSASAPSAARARSAGPRRPGTCPNPQSPAAAGPHPWTPAPAGRAKQGRRRAPPRKGSIQWQGVKWRRHSFTRGPAPQAAAAVLRSLRAGQALSPPSSSPPWPCGSAGTPSAWDSHGLAVWGLGPKVRWATDGQGGDEARASAPRLGERLEQVQTRNLRPPVLTLLNMATLCPLTVWST